MATAAKKKFVPGTGSFGKNASYEVTEKGILTITVDLNVTQGKSTSGKSMIIASSGGNQQVPGGEGAIVGLNVYSKV